VNDDALLHDRRAVDPDGGGGTSYDDPILASGARRGETCKGEETETTNQ
jgi:hypothetical protein